MNNLLDLWLIIRHRTSGRSGTTKVSLDHISNFTSVQFPNLHQIYYSRWSGGGEEQWSLNSGEILLMEKFRSWEPLGASLPGRVDPPKRIHQKGSTKKDQPKRIYKKGPTKDPLGERRTSICQKRIRLLLTTSRIHKKRIYQKMTH